MSVKDLKTAEEFHNTVKNSKPNQLLIIHFWESWAPQCGQMNAVMEELAKDTSINNVSYYKVQAESVPEVSASYKIAAVPTFIFIKNQVEVDRLDGANGPELQRKVKQRSGDFVPIHPAPATEHKEDLDTRLKELINRATCMLFIKGSPDEPRCGFSKKIVQILNDHDADYESFDILKDNEVREGLKKFSKWPTYPQLYINGELIGGLDIIGEMIESGDFDQTLPKKK